MVILTLWFFQPNIFPSVHVIFDFFHQSLIFPEYRFFASLGRFIPKYFVLFDIIVNGVIPLISLSDILLLVYKNEADLCILILYPTT